jgi:hypothetical protein
MDKVFGKVKRTGFYSKLLLLSNKKICTLLKCCKNACESCSQSSLVRVYTFLVYLGQCDTNRIISACVTIA